MFNNFKDFILNVEPRKLNTFLANLVTLPLLTPLSFANGSMGVQYIPWVINEHCLEFTQLSSRNIDFRVVPDWRMQEM